MMNGMGSMPCSFSVVQHGRDHGAETVSSFARYLGRQRMNKDSHRHARGIFVFFAFFSLLLVSAPLHCREDNQAADAKWHEDDDYLNEQETVSDPLEPVNRVFFHFNDKLYFWVVKPASQVYSYFLADDVRMCVRDFFHNLLTPVRIANNLFQGKLKNSGIETARFVINSTVGVAGLADPAKREFNLVVSDEDLGQTLGVYGVGSGIYICWPFFGPSNLRDTVGLIGDTFLSPLTYLTASEAAAGIGAHAGKHVNNTSLTIGDYEDFKDASFDPYIALRDAYAQYRRNKILDSSDKDSVYSRSMWQQYLAFRSGEAQKIGTRADRTQDDEKTGGDAFHIQVGTSIDPLQAREMCLKLASLDQESVVKVYDEGSYSYYGVQVPAGDSFAAAKYVEQRLVEAGFPEAHVVN